MNLAVLANELQASHPITGAYSVDDVTAASQVNAVNIVRDRTSMTGREIAAEIVDAEYDALEDETIKAQVIALVSTDSVDPFGFSANVIKDIFPASATLAALALVRIETISRATQLGIGNVRAGDVQRARA
jgi:hypothetical protein